MSLDEMTQPQALGMYRYRSTRLLFRRAWSLLFPIVLQPCYSTELLLRALTNSATHDHLEPIDAMTGVDET